MAGRCDIVVPVHGAVHLARDLLESIERWTAGEWRVWLVDDGSDPGDALVLGELAATRSTAARPVRLHRFESNQGFVAAANFGMAAALAAQMAEGGVKGGGGSWICLLNSDTVVTPGWLEGLIRCAESDPRIAVVNPVSCSAVNLSVAMPPGVTIHGMADRLRERTSTARGAAIAPSPAPALDVVTPVGFCLLWRVAALRELGLFDPVFGRGYCEESDWCMRALAAGWRTVVAPEVFVWHRGGASFRDETHERYTRNRAVFDQRWGEVFPRRRAESVAAGDPLQPLRDALFADLEIAGALWERHPAAPLRVKLARLAGHLTHGHWPILARRIREEMADLGERIRQSAEPSTERPEPRADADLGAAAAPLRDHRLDPEDQPRAFPRPAYLARLPRAADRLRVAFLLHDAPLSGGVLQIVQIVNRLVLEGHDAILVTTSREEIQRRFGVLSQPLVFADTERLLADFPGADVLVATWWQTAELAAALAERGGGVPVYYAQDFEADFYPAWRAEEKRAAAASYGRVAHRIVTSQWLAGRLAEQGLDATVIPYGIDRGLFHPRARTSSPDSEMTITAITRPDPDETRRGFRELLAACDEVATQMPAARFVFFGCDPAAMPRRVPFAYRHLGRIEDPELVARHLAQCDLLVDPSQYQAFGRPGLEAMACGVATVLPRQGGIGEYALDGVNTVSFEGGDARSLARAMLAVLRDSNLRARLSHEGLRTADCFDHLAEGRRHLDLYRSLLS